jgi:hypothetical protein
MKTRVNNVHYCLFVRESLYYVRKQWLNFLKQIILNNIGRKGLGPLFLYSLFFESTNTYKNGDEAQQRFLEDLVFYICKGYGQAFFNM